MSEFKIEKGIPITGAKAKSQFTEALMALEIGDSFDIAGTSVCSKNKAYLSATVSLVGKRCNKKYSWRGTRVWRVA